MRTTVTDNEVMSTLYIDRKDLHIKLDGNAIAFYANGVREGLIPIKPLKRVIISGRVVIETPVLHRLADENISVLFLSGKRRRFMGILHGRLHNNGYLRLKQYEKSLTDFSFRWAKEIVIRKLRGQVELLKDALELRHDCRLELTRGLATLNEVTERILSLRDNEMDRLRGFEGGAAAGYFRAYTSLFPPSLGFKKRRKRPPRDPVNAMLSLTYTLIHWEGVREVELIGLDPTIGYLHEFDYGRESLACDLIEPLRPMADRWIWYLFRARVFTERDFTTGAERPGCYLKKGARRRYYQLYEEWVGALRSELVCITRELARRLIDGQDSKDHVCK